jgi:hypothetical protein
MAGGNHYWSEHEKKYNNNNWYRHNYFGLAYRIGAAISI